MAKGKAGDEGLQDQESQIKAKAEVEQAEQSASNKAKDAVAAAKDASAKRAAYLTGLYLKDVEARKVAWVDRKVPVIVQRRRDRPVQLFGGVLVPCRTPVMVNQKELRRLEGMRSAGAIQLIVGELEQPAQLAAPKFGSSAGPAKGA